MHGHAWRSENRFFNDNKLHAWRYEVERQDTRRVSEPAK
jgi:hypothetical protein